MIIFKDRIDAGKKLAKLILKSNFFKKIKERKDVVVVSLLRGGFIVGAVLAKTLRFKNLALPVAKISHPQNPELAIGALCFSKIYWENNFLKGFFSKEEFNQALKKSKQKFVSYSEQFFIEEKDFNSLKDKVVILVDDGVATGATIKAAFLFLKEKKPKKIILAVPVAPADFRGLDFDKFFIYHKEKDFSAISQFYDNFSQVDNEEIIKLLKSK